MVDIDQKRHSRDTWILQLNCSVRAFHRTFRGKLAIIRLLGIDIEHTNRFQRYLPDRTWFRYN